MSTQNISNYTRDLEENIIDTSPSVDGQLKFAIDTGKLFLSNGGYWHIYSATDMLGEYKLPGTAITVDAPIVAHLDANDSTTLQDGNYQPINAGDHVANWRCVTDGGSNHVTQHRPTRQPTYVAGAMNGLPVIRFATDQFLQPFPRKAVSIVSGPFTAFSVINLNYRGDPVTGNKESDWTDYNPIWGGEGYEGSATIQRQPALNVRWDVAQGTWASVGGGQTACSIALPNSSTFGAGSTPTVFDLQTDNIIVCQRFIGSAEGWQTKTQSITIGGRYTKTLTGIVGGLVDFHGLCLATNNMQASVNITGRFDMGEFILLNGELNNGQVNDVANHLSTKWGAVWEDLL